MSTPNHGPEHDSANAKRLRTLYREASRHIDPNTHARLRAARRDALHSASHPPHRSSLVNRWLIPAGALAAMGLATLMLWHPRPIPSTQLATPAQVVTAGNGGSDNELPPDADQTDPQLYQNLDFYGWLAANDPPASGH